MDLSEDEAEASLQYLLDDASEAAISAFLVLLRAKGETYEEVSPLFELFSEFVLVIVSENENVVKRLLIVNIFEILCVCAIVLLFIIKDKPVVQDNIKRIAE